MKRSPAWYGRLFGYTFLLSAFTFGGGYVIVPLMKKRFVDQLGWIDEAEMLDMVAIGQSCPGSLAINASILLGYRLAGLAGALTTVLATVLPPLITISALSVCYTLLRDSAQVAAVLHGMQIGVAAVIVNVVCQMARDIARQNARALLLTALVFALAAFAKVNVALILLPIGLIGALLAMRKGRRA